MPSAKFEIEVDGVILLAREFIRFDEIQREMRTIWPFVQEAFLRMEREQFRSEGGAGASGRWKPLSEKYRKWKEIKYPGRPILELKTRLMPSLTRRGARGSVYIAEPMELTLGTRVVSDSGFNYPLAHQQGIPKGSGRLLPRRPPIDPSDSQKRLLQKEIQKGLLGRFSVEIQPAGILKFEPDYEGAIF